MIEEIWSLIRDIETGTRWLKKHLDPESKWSYLALHYGNVAFTSNDGWKLIVFFDCGEWDNFDRFISPSGETLRYGAFPDDLKYYTPPIEVRKIMYGEPGYLAYHLDRRHDDEMPTMPRQNASAGNSQS